MDLYLSPSGDDTHDGRSPATAWRALDRLNAWLAELPSGSHRVRFRAGATFPGSIYAPSGDPDNPILLESDGDALATIRPPSGAGALYAQGAGGWHLKRLRALGDGSSLVSGLELGDDGRTPCRNIRVEDCEAEGWNLVGLVIWSRGLPVSGVVVSGGRYCRSACGVVVGCVDESLPSERKLFNVRVSSVQAHDNDLRGGGMSGFGINVTGAVGVEIRDCQTHRNGRTSTEPGHAGIQLYCCQNVLVVDCTADDNHDPNPVHGDGAGINLDDVWDAVVARCRCARNRGGVVVMGEQRGHGSRNITVRDCTLEDNLTGLAVSMDCERVVFYRNSVFADGRTGAYKALDVYRAEPWPLTATFTLNVVRAVWGAILLEANSLRGVGLAGTFEADRPVYRVGGRDFAKLEDALASEPVGVP